jgi:hypothetical protein
VTIYEFAQKVIEDAAYRDGVLARARAGTLDPSIELLLLEAYEMGDERRSIATRAVAAQSRTLALIRPPVEEEEIGNDA